MIYLVSWENNTILVNTLTKEQATSIAFHVFVSELDVDPKRLINLGWPSDVDIRELESLEDVAEPVLINQGK